MEKAFTALGVAIAWMAMTFIGVPVLRVCFGALGGYIIQIFVGNWVIGGAAQFGVTLEPNRLWEVGAVLSWIGMYFNIPAPPKTD